MHLKQAFTPAIIKVSVRLTKATPGVVSGTSKLFENLITSLLSY